MLCPIMWKQYYVSHIINCRIVETEAMPQISCRLSSEVNYNFNQ